MDNTGQEQDVNVPILNQAQQPERKFFHPSKNILFIILIITLPVLLIGAIIYFIVLGNLSLTNSGSSTNIPEPTNITAVQINDGEVIYESLGQLYTFDTSTMKSTILPINDLPKLSKEERDGVKIPSSLSFSPSGRYLFFNANRKFYIYDFNKGEYEKLDIEPNPALSLLEIAPNNKIIVVDTRTGPGAGGKKFIDLENKTILYSNVAYSIAWSSDSKKFTSIKGEIDWNNLALGPSPQNKSIFLGELREDGSISEKLLLKADRLTSYWVDKWIDINTILFAKERFREPIPESFPGDYTEEYQKYWLDIWENPSVSYWQYNIENRKQKQLSDYTPEKVVSSKIGVYSPSEKWKVSIEGEWPNRAIYIIKTDGTTDKIKINEGNYAVWRPAVTL